MTIENLIAVIPPPDRPSEAFGGTWELIEAELGTALPQDYKDFVRLYGRGYLMEFFGIDIPRARNPNCRLEAKVRTVLAAFAGANDLPYPMWPDPGGLLPFGKTDNGDHLFWRTDGDPADWRVVLWDRGLQRFEIFDCDLTDFVAGLARGDIVPEPFPEDLATCDYLFQPDVVEPEPLRLRLIPARTASERPGASEDVLFPFSWNLGSYVASGRSVCRLHI